MSRFHLHHEDPPGPHAQAATAIDDAPTEARLTEAEPGAAPPPGVDEPPLVIPKTRTGSTYTGIGVGLVVLAVIIVFIAQNLHDAGVHFFTLHFQLAIGLLVLASAVGGGLIVAGVGAARIVQFRLMARRHKAGRPTA